MICTDSPDDLDEKARALDRRAIEIEGGGTVTAVGNELRRDATELRKRAAELRRKRTDGVRFG